MKIKSLLTAFALWAAFNTAYAVNIYRTGFEDPPFVAGSELLGTDGWSTAIPPFLNPHSAIITNAIKKSGHQSVVVPGASLSSSGGLTGPYDAIGSYRRPVNFQITPNKAIIKLKADLQLKTAKDRTPGEFFSLTIAARTGNGETLGEIGLSSQGIVEAWNFNAPGGGPPDFTLPIRFNGWYHVEMVFDFNSKTLSYFINDTLLGSTPAPTASDVLLRGAMVVYARPNGGVAGGAGSDRADYTAVFDNFRISADDEDD